MNKRVISTLLCVSLVIAALAAEKNLKRDVTMISYEQSWLDHEGSLALRNNTNTEIYNISFRIIYLDMSGNQLDYRDFKKRVDIAPGMTKKIDVTAYEYGRSYHYYKNTDSSNHPAFKIKFELLDYNIDGAVNDLDSESIYGIMVLLLIFFVVVVALVLPIIVGIMAHKRKRSVILWVFLSFIITPILAIILLALIGDKL